MKSTRDITIAKLKQQPKHGATGFGNLDDFLKSVEKINKSGDLQNIANQLDATKASFISLKDVIDDSTKAVAAVITETDKLSAGYGRISTVQQQYQHAVIKQIKNTTALEEANAELNKTLKMSSARAFDFSKGLRGLNKEVEGQRKRINLSDASLFKYAKTLHGITGGLSSFSKKFQDADGNITAVGENLLRTQGYLQQNLGMTEEQAAAFEMYAGGMKMSGQQAVAQLGDLVDSLTAVGAGFYEGADAAQLQSQIVGDIAEAGEVIQLQYSKMPGNLEVASLKARALGTTLKQLHSTGEAMLNIESSIGQELEYQALTGHRLLDSQGKSLTNEYRMATIRGDQTRQAELMAKFIKDEGDTLSNNLFARKKAAELMGTDEATLARMIQKQKALADLGMEQIMKLSADDQKTAIEKARKEAEAKGDVDRIKAIDKMITDTDTRTTAERSEEHLLAIRSALTAEKIQAGKTGKDFIGDLRKGDAKSAFGYAEKMITSLTATDTVKTLGSIGIVADRLSTVSTPLSQLTNMLPDSIGKFASKATGLLTKLNTMLPTPITTPEPNGGKNNAKGGPVAAGDISLVGEQGPELVQFARNAYVTPTNQTKAALGGPGIDYARLGAAVAMAMQSANITATVRTDNLYGTSRMNPMPKNLG